MKYIGTCILTEDILNGIKISKYNQGCYGISLNAVYVYIPIKHSNNQEPLYSKFNVNGMDETHIYELIDNLCDMTSDIVRENIPLTERQISTIKQIIESNPPKSAIYTEPNPSNSLVLGAYRSGDNYSIKLGSNIICDLNGKTNAEKIVSIISSAFYQVIKNLKKQINAPE